MLFIRCKVTCDGCQNREEVFDAAAISSERPELPGGWAWGGRAEDSDDDPVIRMGEPEPTPALCPSCAKKVKA